MTAAQHLIRFTAALLLAILTPLPATAAVEWPESSRTVLQARLSLMVEENKVAGLAVGVVVSNNLVFAEGYGAAELGKPAPITPDSVFHWASVSKPLVAVAIMQLAYQGMVSLDDPLTKHLPWFQMADPRYTGITLRQLLSHTAGMPDVDDYGWDAPETDAHALKRWLLELKSAQLLFAPGSGREYSNIGFEVLGLVVQEVSGIPFEHYLHANIFAPLGMSNSSFFPADIIPSLRVSGHLGDPVRSVAPHYPYNRRHAPSSTLNSSIVDMARFAAAMLHNGQLEAARILAPGAVGRMWANAWTSAENPQQMAGLGWHIGRPWGGLFAASHAGHDDGFRSFLFIAPEEDIAVLLVANDDQIAIGKFVRTVLEGLFPGRNTRIHPRV